MIPITVVLYAYLYGQWPHTRWCDSNANTEKCKKEICYMHAASVYDKYVGIKRPAIILFAVGISKDHWKSFRFGATTVCSCAKCEWEVLISFRNEKAPLCLTYHWNERRVSIASYILSSAQFARTLRTFEQNDPTERRRQFMYVCVLCRMNTA